MTVNPDRLARTEGRRYIDTVLGPIKIIPECKVQAVCVNGLKCWEAGQCLRVAARVVRADTTGFVSRGTGSQPRRLEVGTRVRLDRELFSHPPEVRATGRVTGYTSHRDGTVAYRVVPDPGFNPNVVGVVWHESEVVVVEQAA